MINGIILEYNNLKLDLQQKKIIFIFTDGSLIELKKAVLFNETDFEKSKNDYESLDIKSIFPIINKNRYGKNIFYLKKLIDKLNKSQIPFIIFYIGEELNNGIDNIIINHIKKFKNRPEYKSILENIVKKEEQISNNISQSYILRTVNKNLKQINKNKIFNMIKDICNSVSSEVVLEYHKFLYDNLISQKEIEAKFNILIFSVIPKDYLSDFEKKIEFYNTQKSAVNINLIYIDEKEILNKISEYNDKNFIKKYLIIYSDKSENIDIKYNIELDIKDELNCIEIISDIKKIYSDFLKNYLKNYVLSHFLHFNEEKYMNLGLLHKKIVYDIINLSEVLPIKAKKIKDEKNIFF